MSKHPKHPWAGGAFLMFLAAALSAWRAHGLPEFLSAESLVRFDSALEQQFLGAAGILFCGILGFQTTSPWIGRGAWLFALGIALFCGDVYLRAFQPQSALHTASFGGLFLILGWAALGWAALAGKWSRHPDSNWG